MSAMIERGEIPSMNSFAEDINSNFLNSVDAYKSSDAKFSGLDVFDGKFVKANLSACANISDSFQSISFKNLSVFDELRAMIDIPKIQNCLSAATLDISLSAGLENVDSSLISNSTIMDAAHAAIKSPLIERFKELNDFTTGIPKNIFEEDDRYKELISTLRGVIHNIDFANHEYCVDQISIETDESTSNKTEIYVGEEIVTDRDSFPEPELSEEEVLRQQIKSAHEKGIDVVGIALVTSKQQYQDLVIEVNILNNEIRHWSPRRASTFVTFQDMGLLKRNNIDLNNHGKMLVFLATHQSVFEKEQLSYLFPSRDSVINRWNKFIGDFLGIDERMVVHHKTCCYRVRCLIQQIN